MNEIYKIESIKEIDKNKIEDLLNKYKNNYKKNYLI